MSAKTWIFVGTGAFFVLALGIGWYGLQSERQSGASLASLNQNLAQLDASLQKAQEQSAARQRDLAAAQDRLRVAQAETKRRNALAEAKAKAPATPQGTSNAKSPTLLMASDPKLKDLHLKEFRANLVECFGPMYQKLGLTPAQIDKFEDMATAHEDDRLSMFEVAAAQGFGETDPGFLAIRQQSIDQYYASLGTELSPVLQQEVVQLDATRGRIGAMQGLVGGANNLIPSGTPPLTYAQSAQVAQILASSSATYQSGGNADPSALDWNSVSPQLAAVLSGPQLQAVQHTLQLQALVAKVKQFYARQPPHP